MKILRTAFLGLLLATLSAQAAGPWAPPFGGLSGGGTGCTDGVKGNVTVSGGCTTWTVTGATAVDNAFTLTDNGDATKSAQFDAALVPTGTQVVYKMPSSAGTLARLEDIPAFQATGGNYIVPGGGCGVVYSGTGFAYNVAACTYVINGVQYTSPPATVTLSAAHGSLDRIDIIAVNTSSIATSITGTAASNPQAPDVDPDTQLQLTFVYVVAASTQPGVVQTVMYRENTGPAAEWTYTDNSANLNPADTAQPFAGTIDIAATAAVSGDQFSLTNGSAIDLSQQNYLALRIRPNGTWPSSKLVRLTWKNGTTFLGSTITLTNGAYGLNTASATYQVIAVPVSSFNLNGATVDGLRVLVQGSGAAVSFYIDNVELQSGVAPPTSSSYMTYAGDYSASNTYTPSQVVRYQSNHYVNISAAVNSAPAYDDSNTKWRRLYSDETVTSLGTLVHGATAKTTPVSADEIPLIDSAASFVTKKVTFANLTAGLQPLDSDLTTIAGLTATTDSFIQSKSSAWASRTIAQVTTDLQGTGSAADTVGFRGIPQQAQSGNYTLVLADAGKHVFHASGDGSGDTYTIPANSSVAFPVGTAVTFVNLDSNTVSIAITTDTMTLCGTGSTGTRTLAQYGEVTALKVASTSWVLCGTGAT